MIKTRKGPSMATTDISVLGYLHPAEDARYAAELERCLAALEERGYALATDAEQSTSTPHSPGRSKLLQTEKDEYLAGKRAELSFQASATAPSGLTWSFALSLEDQMFFASVSDRYFTSDDKTASANLYSHWLELLQLLSNIWRPFYGYTADFSGVLPSTEREDALAFRPLWLYDINIFGGAMVAHWGQQRVLNTPAWKILPLDDGGVLLAPIPYHSASNPDDQLARCAQHLGVPFEPLAQRIRHVRPDLFNHPKGGLPSSQ
jgi:hypothetical protein